MESLPAVPVLLVVLLVVAVLAVVFHLRRQSWAHRALSAGPPVEFDGSLHRVGETSIAIKQPQGPPTRTLICMPGFMEDSRYFLDVHGAANPQDELIIVNNAHYHCPFDEQDATALDWEPNPHPPGTIAHDGLVLARVIEHLATTDDIVIHGHSRGGAATLDAGRQFPQLMKDGPRRITALLEAPVLPQATPAGPVPGPVTIALTDYFLPLVFGRMRRLHARWLRRLPMMHPTTEVKRAVLETMFHAPKTYATCVVNVHDITLWQQSQQHDLYDNFHQITVVVGERDDVLNTRTMIASANQGAERNPGVRIIQTTGTNHFISLEQPNAIRAALNDTGDATKS